jgi:predicted RNA-binding Zn ribbon-like protein
MVRVVTLADAAGSAQPLFVDFVNTLHWYEGAPIELLGDAPALADWLADHALPTVAPEAALPALLSLRGHARAITEALATGRPPAPADLEALERALARPTGRLVLRGAGARPQLAFALDDDRAEAAFRIALSLATFLESGDRHRLKLCANAGCGFAFLDTSTNGTRRWCDMRYCGNRLKARAFRRRRAERPGSPPPPVAGPASPGEPSPPPGDGDG